MRVRFQPLDAYTCVHIAREHIYVIAITNANKKKPGFASFLVMVMGFDQCWIGEEPTPSGRASSTLMSLASSAASWGEISSISVALTRA